MAIVFNWATNNQIAFQGAVATDTSFTTSMGANTINAGDTIIVVCGVGDQTSASVDPGALVPPGGWTQLVNLNAGSSGANERGAAFFKIAGAGETGNYVFSWTTGNPWAWAMLDYSGTAATTDGVAGTASATFAFVVSPSITVANAGGTIIVASVEGSTPTTPAGFNLRSALAQGGTYVNQPAIAVADFSPVPAGATGTIAWGSSTANSAITITANFDAGGGPAGINVWPYRV